MTQIRGVFPLPQTSPQIAGVDQVVCLVSGGMYVLPAGNFLVTTGPNTALQWFDPIATIWRPNFNHQPLGYLNSDGANYRLLNTTGTVQSVSTGGAGSNGTNGIGPVQTGTSVSLTPSPTGQQAQAYIIIGGAVPAPNVVQGGSGFVVPPIVCCDPPPVGGRQALFTATINAQGAISAVNLVDGGAGYTSVPQFYVIPQPMFYQGAPRWPGDTVVQPWPAPGTISPFNVWPGTIYQPNISPQGALLVGQPLTSSGTPTGYALIYGGGGYTAAPTITVTGGPLTGAAPIVVMDANPPANQTSYLNAKVN